MARERAWMLAMLPLIITRSRGDLPSLSLTKGSAPRREGGRERGRERGRAECMSPHHYQVERRLAFPVFNEGVGA